MLVKYGLSIFMGYELVVLFHMFPILTVNVGVGVYDPCERRYSIQEMMRQIVHARRCTDRLWPINSPHTVFL